MTDMHLSSSLLDQLEPHFTLRDADAVLAVIQSNMEMVDLPRYTPDALLFLEAVEEDEILLSVNNVLNRETVYDAMQAFDREWWLANLGRGEGKVVIHPEFWIA